MLRMRFKKVWPDTTVRVALPVMLASFFVLFAGAGTATAEHREGETAAHENSVDGNTSAVAVNTRDNSSVFRLSFAIIPVTDGIVENQNIADAYASCTSCQTVAISIQTLLVQGSPTTFAPINEASSQNSNCTECDTLALAYQFVIAGAQKLRFTAEGRQEIADIRQQLEGLRHSGLTGPQIDAQVNGLMAQYANVLATQLVPVGKPAEGSDAPAGSGVSTSGSTEPTSVTSMGATTAPAPTTSTPANAATISPTTSSTPTTTKTTSPTTTPSNSTTTSTSATTRTTPTTTAAPASGTSATPTEVAPTTPTTGTSNTSGGTTTTATPSAGAPSP